METPEKHLEQRLTDRQLTLFQSITKMNVDIAKDIANWYIGSFFILADEDNPDRIALSAHGIREMMEKFPRLVDVPTKRSNEPIFNEVRILANNWEKTKRNTDCIVNDIWEGELDGSLIDMLSSLGEFFLWLEREVPTRQVEYTRMLNGFSDSVLYLPQNIKDKTISQWTELFNFFTNTSHHSLVPNLMEFQDNISRLEMLMNELLNPRTLEDFDDIDKLIEEVEHEPK